MNHIPQVIYDSSVGIISLYGHTNATSACLKIPIVFVDLFPDALQSSPCLLPHLSPNPLGYQLFFPFPSSLPYLSTSSSIRETICLHIYILLSILLISPSPTKCLRVYSHLAVPLSHHPLLHTALSRCLGAGVSGRRFSLPCS